MIKKESLQPPSKVIAVIFHTFVSEKTDNMESWSTTQLQSSLRNTIR